MCYCFVLFDINILFGGDEFTITWILSKGVYFSKRLNILLCLILISIITYGSYYMISLQHDEKSVKGHVCKGEGRSCVHLNVGVQIEIIEVIVKKNCVPPNRNYYFGVL
jgi:hypothetical protein